MEFFSFLNAWKKLESALFFWYTALTTPSQQMEKSFELQKTVTNVDLAGLREVSFRYALILKFIHFVSN